MKALWGRVKAIWFVLRYRNFILVYDIEEIKIKGEDGRRTAYLRRTDYNTESDFYSMKHSMVHQFGQHIMDEENRIGEYMVEPEGWSCPYCYGDGGHYKGCRFYKA